MSNILELGSIATKEADDCQLALDKDPNNQPLQISDFEARARAYNASLAEELILRQKSRMI